jgi:hypothetical protein
LGFAFFVAGDVLLAPVGEFLEVGFAVFVHDVGVAGYTGRVGKGNSGMAGRAAVASVPNIHPSGDVVHQGESRAGCPCHENKNGRRVRRPFPVHTNLELKLVGRRRLDLRPAKHA